MKLKTLSIIGCSAIFFITLLLLSFFFEVSLNALIFISMIFILLTISFVWLASSVSKPLLSIQESIEQITKGNMNVQFENSGVEEVRNMVNALNRILVSLKLAVMRTNAGNKSMTIQEIIQSNEKMEKQLRISDDFVKDMLQHSGIPFVSYSTDGRLLSANSDFMKLTSYTKEDIATRKEFFEEAFPSEMVTEKLGKILSDLYGGREISDFVIPIRCKDGSTVISVSNIMTMHDSEGQNVGEAFFFRDLSEIFDLQKDIMYWAANGFIQKNRPEDEVWPTSGGKIEISSSATQETRGQEESGILNAKKRIGSAVMKKSIKNSGSGRQRKAR